jgi:hypothetical protein
MHQYSIPKHFFILHLEIAGFEMIKGPSNLGKCIDKNLSPYLGKLGILSKSHSPFRSFERFCGPQTLFAWDLHS